MLQLLFVRPDGVALEGSADEAVELMSAQRPGTSERGIVNSPDLEPVVLERADVQRRHAESKFLGLVPAGVDEVEHRRKLLVFEVGRFPSRRIRRWDVRDEVFRLCQSVDDVGLVGEGREGNGRAARGTKVNSRPLSGFGEEAMLT